MYSRILVPVDMENSDQLTKALDLAAQTAKASDATVVYIDVVDAVPTMSAHTDGEKMTERLDAFAAAQAKAHGIKTSDHIVLRGDLHPNLGKDIVKAAKDGGCDLIVMASHVPGFVDHFLTSHAGYVASHAPMSVYVVR
ncbi:MAG: universal stress protein [Silicimonas sp.]|nr:universal stress protein [Silicimonas sp.]